MKKNGIFAVLLFSAALTLTACAGREEAPDYDPDEVERITWDEPEEEPLGEDVIDLSQIEQPPSHEGEARSMLTGLWVDEALTEQRPIAVMFGNTVDALPQYGISHADVLYEIPVEGGITRLMGIMEDHSGITRLESVRSARLYFAEIAVEYDAIYCHVGQAPYAEKYLNSSAVTDFNGLDGTLSNVSFFRDTDRKAPHNAYVTSESIDAGIEAKGFRREYEADFQPHFQFAEEEKERTTAYTDEQVTVIRAGYGLSNTRFEYSSEDNLYYRYHYKRAHTDGTTGEQLAFSNVIIMGMNGAVIDDNGYLRFDTVGSGSGMYFADGRMVEIVWRKESLNSRSIFYDASGNELRLAPGKTAICVVDSDYMSRVMTFRTYADYEEYANG